VAVPVLRSAERKGVGAVFGARVGRQPRGARLSIAPYAHPELGVATLILIDFKHALSVSPSTLYDKYERDP